MCSAANRARHLLRLTPRTRLALDVVLVLLFLALDVRDVWFKLWWLGPHDSYSFVAVTHHEMQDEALEPMRNLTRAGQKHQRTSGWSSFLQKCDALHPITDSRDAATFAYAMGKNCHLGVPESKHVVPELVMSSSVRVDSVAWTACKLLYHHRKPAICHSPVVRLFAERYNMDEAPSLLAFKHHNNASLSVWDASQHEPQNYTAAPGSDAEAELTDLLSVISTSSPLSAVVCIEAFVPHGPGRYTASIFGCGSPSYYRSAFVGFHATAFPLFQQDKARLTSDALHVLGMTFVTRENSRSLFSLRNGARGVFELRHKALLNFSSFGVLYTLMVSIDVLLLVLNVCSAVEIGCAVHSGSQQTHNYKLGVLTAPLYRSKVVAALTVVTHVIAWMVILPSVSIWDATELQTGKTHAWLTVSRAWVLALVAVNALWDLCVALHETQALAFVRTTYVRVTEVAAIALLVAYAKRDAVFAITEAKRQVEGQRLRDALSFRDFTARANAFAGQLDFVQNTPSAVLQLVYAPLLEIVVWSVVAVAALALVRSWYFRAVHHDLLSDHRSSLVVSKKRLSKFAVVPDASESPTKPLLSGSTVTDATTASSRSVQFAPSPAPSPTRGGFVTAFRDLGGAGTGAGPLESESSRLPIEEIVDVPVRARSLVRSVWLMEKRAGQSVGLHPSLLLEHGIAVRNGGATMQTRCGFWDVVHPFLSARTHAVATMDEASLQKQTKSSEQVLLH